MYMDLLAAALVLFLSFVLINNRKEPKKLFGVYSQEGKWYFFKYHFMLTTIVLRRLKYYLLGKKGLFNEKDLDRRQPLSNHPDAFDAVFFHAGSQDGIFMALGSERRHGGVINGLLYIIHPKFGLLKSMKLPNTKLQEDPESVMSGKEWAAEGMRITPLEPFKRWDVSYTGEMRVHETGKIVQVQMQAKWTSDMPWFLFEVDLPAKMLARSLAREAWSREYFDHLKETYQTHYEQMGFLDGTLKVDGDEVPLKVDAFRDHSFGKERDWSLMHRYIFHTFYLENQTRVVLGLVCQPSSGSHYEMGYVVHANGKIKVIDTCDLKLWQHGEGGRPSDELCFTFTSDEHVHECKVKYETTVAHLVGDNRAVKMYERCLTCEINGVKGKGIGEWCYSNTSGKFNLNQYEC